MYSIKKWFAAKISNNPSNEDGLNSDFNSEPGRSSSFSDYSNIEQSSSNQQLQFNISKGAKTILQFYYSDDELNMIASELESFDGRRDPLRCTELVSQLRIAQDKVMQLLFQLMDEWNCNRASRDYRLKFPEDLLNDSDNGESFNGQIWFSAECLASGSDIMNHETESDMLRPLAKILTNNLDQLRIMLRQSTNEVSNKVKFYQDLIYKMEQFDRMFSAFEFEYVKAMLPIKSVEDLEKQQELTILFSEALGFAIKRNLIKQEDVDECNPSVIITLPRLAIIHGLVRCGNDNPLFRRHKHNLSNMFKSYHSALHRIYGMLKSLRPIEIFMLEKLLSNEENLNDCVDSIFEEPNSYKHYNDYPSESVNFKIEENTSIRVSCEKLKKSISLPNLLKLEDNNKSIYLNKDNIRDEVDLSLSQVTKKAKKFLSSVMLNKSKDYSENEKDLGFKNKHFKNNSFNDTQAFYSTSQQSDATTTGSSSSIDSYEIKLALKAKNSNFISELAKQLLHKLFVSISCIADQLQSNFACDLRQILKSVFLMHTENVDEIDNTVLEEAEEALETTNVANEISNFDEILNNSENLQLLFTTTLNAIENANNANHTSQEDNHNSNMPNSNNLYENYSINFNDQLPNEELIRFQPVWVPDDLVNECTICKAQFTLLRRRHHCRNCGKIFCNNCSKNYMCLLHFGYNKPVRVCDICYFVPR